MSESEQPDVVIDPARFRRHGEPVLLVNEMDAARLRELGIPNVIVSPVIPAGHAVIGQRVVDTQARITVHVTKTPPAEQPGD